MANLADIIEEYLLELFGETKELSIQRSSIASLFRCAPSQISYVLETRFTPARGFRVESRRGGGGYIRITRMPVGADELFRVVDRRIGTAIDSRAAEHSVLFLRDKDAISEREAQMMLAVSRSINHPDPRVRDAQRAALLRSMLVALISEE